MKKNNKKSIIFRLLCGLLVFLLIESNLQPLQAQETPFLPVQSNIVELSSAYSLPVLRGMRVYSNKPFQFDFVVDSGNRKTIDQKETALLIKYFLTCLTVPQEDLWVNLSPYEKDRIIPNELALTAAGNGLLEQDRLLKQLASSLTYPESRLGKEFWKQVYKKAEARFGTTNLPINTYNKVWIVPEKAVVYDMGSSALIGETHLKVMLEEDYLALRKHISTTSIKENNLHQVSSLITKEIILPQLEKEINEGQNFAPVRQIFHSMILAAWFKQALKRSILSSVYVDQKKIAGVDDVDISAREKIYQQYLHFYKVGAYNYIREDVDPITQQVVPRKYFSGGFDAKYMSNAMVTISVPNVMTALQMYHRSAKDALTFAWTRVQLLIEKAKNKINQVARGTALERALVTGAIALTLSGSALAQPSAQMQQQAYTSTAQQQVLLQVLDSYEQGWKNAGGRGTIKIIGDITAEATVANIDEAKDILIGKEHRPDLIEGVVTFINHDIELHQEYLNKLKKAGAGSISQQDRVSHLINDFKQLNDALKEVERAGTPEAVTAFAPSPNTGDVQQGAGTASPTSESTQSSNHRIGQGDYFYNSSKLSSMPIISLESTSPSHLELTGDNLEQFKSSLQRLVSHRENYEFYKQKVIRSRVSIDQERIQTLKELLKLDDKLKEFSKEVADQPVTNLTDYELSVYIQELKILSDETYLPESDDYVTNRIIVPTVSLALKKAYAEAQHRGALVPKFPQSYHPILPESLPAVNLNIFDDKLADTIRAMVEKRQEYRRYIKISTVLHEGPNADLNTAIEQFNLLNQQLALICEQIVNQPLGITKEQLTLNFREIQVMEDELKAPYAPIDSHDIGDIDSFTADQLERLSSKEALIIGAQQKPLVTGSGKINGGAVSGTISFRQNPKLIGSLKNLQEMRLVPGDNSSSEQGNANTTRASGTVLQSSIQPPAMPSVVPAADLATYDLRKFEDYLKDLLKVREQYKKYMVKRVYADATYEQLIPHIANIKLLNGAVDQAYSQMPDLLKGLAPKDIEGLKEVVENQELTDKVKAQIQILENVENNTPPAASTADKGMSAKDGGIDLNYQPQFIRRSSSNSANIQDAGMSSDSFEGFKGFNFNIVRFKSGLTINSAFHLMVNAN